MESKYRYYRRDKKAMVDRLKRLLLGKDVLLAIAFGSFVDLGEFRDIDIAVYTLEKSLSHYAKLSAKFELELGIPVDIVPLDELPTTFRRKVLAKGTIIFETAPGLYEALLNQTYDELILMKNTR